MKSAGDHTIQFGLQVGPPVTNTSVRGLLRAPSSDLPHSAAIATVALLAIVTVVSFMTTQFRAFVPGVDLALDTVAGIAMPAIAVLAWARYRELGDPIGLHIAAASLVLVVADQTALVQLLVDQDGATLARPLLQAPSYVAGVATLMVAALFIVGVAAALVARNIKLPLLVLLAPAAVLLALMALFRLLEPILPALVLSAGPDLTPGEEAFSDLARPTTLGAFFHLSLAALLAVTAGLARRLYRRRRRGAEGALVAASVFAAFAEANAAVDSGISPGYLTPVDVLRLAFAIALFLGLAADARVGFDLVHRSNATVEATRRDDVARGGREERSRLSRELHDGLAQNLWIAKLKVGRLRSLGDAGPEATALSEELSIAIDAGLSEARQAVMALHLPGEGSLSELLNQYVDDFSDAFGLPTDFKSEGYLPPLKPAVMAELLRIAQESLNNARRHADASLVRVSVRVQGDHLTLAIGDDGRGFDVTAVRRGAFGLSGMHERAQMIGGLFNVDSRPLGGTRILVDLPLQGAVMPDPDADP